MQKPFWEKSDSQQRQVITNAFQAYTNWWEKTPIQKHASFATGLLPGDGAATFEADGFSVGVIGLNSAYLQLAEGDFERKLHLDARQLQGVCNGHAPDWINKHDATLLLTHHPVSWLGTNAEKHFFDEIHAPPDRFALHLFGHMHESNLTSMAHSGTNARHTLQGNSIFGLEHWGENQAKREHGYSLCELKLQNGEVSLRIWPRRAVNRKGGGWALERDVKSFELDESDGGTKPIVVKQSKRTFTNTAGNPTPHSVKPADKYDPRNPPFYVPYRDKGDQVIGHDDALTKVRQQLVSGKRTAIGQTAVFQGIGGLGKTQLAVEYAYRYRSEYPNGVIWLTADQDIDAQLADLAVKANWVAPESEHRTKLDVARHRLRSYSDCLIVFDNLEQIDAIQRYLPEHPAEPHVLATSRIEQPEFNYVSIDVLDPEQSLRLLIQEAGRSPTSESEWEAARTIAATLGGLPLALELAGAYLSRRPVDWQDYLTLLQRDLKEALPHRFSSLTKHDADLYSTLRISEAVLADEPRLNAILDTLTWSAPASMGLDLLTELVGVKDPAELTSALGLGVALRILQHTPSTHRYGIHRLVREVRREQSPLPDRTIWVAEQCRRVGEWFETRREDFLELPNFEAEIDHLREWHDASRRFATRQSSRLTWLQAYPAFHRDQNQEIKQLVELALDEYGQSGCDDQALLAHIYNDLAYSLGGLGDPKRALALAEQALDIQRGLFGERHPDTATSLNNVAGYHNALGDPKRALALAEQALDIRRGLFGERHPDTASSLNNVAGYHNALGDPKRALALAEQALDIRRGLFGERHPDVATSLHNLAFMLLSRGIVGRAHTLATEALRIKKLLFSESHPSTLGTLRLLQKIPGFRAPSSRTRDAKKKKRG